MSEDEVEHLDLYVSRDLVKVLDKSEGPIQQIPFHRANPSGCAKTRRRRCETGE